MKKKGLETLVLVVGLLVIGSAIFFIFIKQQTSGTIYITNLIISVGFLIYVIYSIMASNNLNREIRLLDKHVEALKQEIKKQKKQIADKDATIAQRDSELIAKSTSLEEAHSNISNLEAKVKELQAQIDTGDGIL